jgi:Na+-transporting NADH:ubiquinone oxidoreductase subunit B
MNAIRKYLDKIKPNFQKGGKLEYLHSTFDAFETFLFVPNKTTFSGSHIRDYMDMKRTMSMVVLALIPILLFGMWNVGYQHFIANSVESGFWANMLFGARKVLPILIVSYVVGLGIEFAFAQIRGHEVNEGFLVTGFLIPLIVPPDIPLWMVALATAFAVIFGKFGQEKTAYNRARIHTAKSSESWSVCIMFSMKLIKFIKIFLFSFAKWFKNRWGRFFLCLSRSKN